MMEILDNKTLMSIDGGLSLSGAIINAFTSSAKAVLDLGRSLGTAVRRVVSNSLCKL